ncbi:ABC transporter ATP-binding protein [Phreatobacter stygius]|uniref:ABC transporter ATP-binding protein n=1 Tax=Phreatobacter stygius TaxID=1940610 RepID=A0A4D7AYK7_9HYPH|nr:ABC transporter ATP-binding protein [Phreatobacter stygius]QCI66584.1 ABC transporter ATP-binding protein [Phreatobacter stygius]
MLEVVGLKSGYGCSQVLFGVDLQVGKGDIVTLMGRNGMGKTTTIRALIGLNHVLGGEVVFDGAKVTGLRPEVIARRGIGYVPEGRHVFPTLTVHENLVATAANRSGQGAWSLSRVYALFPRLAERQRQYARTLSGGEQQMLAIGRALMTNPKLLVLDEATEGLAPTVRTEIWTCLEALKAERLSILLIDKNVAALRRLATAHTFIEKGVTVWRGNETALAADPHVFARYVGL